MDSTSVPTLWMKNRKRTAKASMIGKVFFMEIALSLLDGFEGEEIGVMIILYP
jgi:hypothetical protein